MRPGDDRERPAGSIKVLNTYPLDDAQRRRLDGLAPTLHVEHRRIEDADAIDALVDRDLVVLLANSVPSDLAQVPALRWLQYSGAGVDPPLTALAPWEHGIVVTTASGGNSFALGEYVMSAIFLAAQRAQPRMEDHRVQRWRLDGTREELFGRSLRGATLVLVGYGSIGREVARLASAFQMRVLAVKSRPEIRGHDRWCVAGMGDPSGEIPERIVGTDAIEEVVALADYVVASVPSTNATRGSLGARILAAMPGRAWLVNVGRGDLFQEDDLVAALGDRRIAGAVLDVTPTEPLPPDSRLWDLPNTIVTPHIAGGSDDIWGPLSKLFAENLRRFAVGEPLVNVYRPELGY